MSLLFNKISKKLIVVF
jgi:ubiquitin-conjugating enzyme E2 S